MSYVVLNRQCLLAFLLAGQHTSPHSSFLNAERTLRAYHISAMNSTAMIIMEVLSIRTE